MACVSSGYSKKAQKLKLDIINRCKSNCQKQSIFLLTMHLDKLWKAILQENFVFTFQNTYEIVAFKTLEVKYIEIKLKFTRDMKLQKETENELCGHLQKNVDNPFQHYKDLILTCALDLYEHYMNVMIKHLKENEEMMKWKHDMKSKIKFLYEELREGAQNYCLQVYQAQKKRTEADNEKGEICTKIQRKVQELVKHVSKRRLPEKELIGYKW